MTVGTNLHHPMPKPKQPRCDSKKCGDCPACRRRSRDRVRDARRRASETSEAREARLVYLADYRRENVDRAKETFRLWRERNPDYEYARTLRRKFGLTPDEYDQLFKEQGGCCGICGADAGDQDRRLAVDHCHQTGRIRGLLCKRCNLTLGAVDDDPSLLRSMIRYLDDQRRTQVA